MALYIQLLTLTPEGREKALEDPESVLRARNGITVPGIQSLSLYGVLGEYDFVNMVEAPDNESMARFSLQLGVQAGVHITTLPAIPVGHLETEYPQNVPRVETEVTLTPPMNS